MSKNILRALGLESETPVVPVPEEGPPAETSPDATETETSSTEEVSETPEFDAGEDEADELVAEGNDLNAASDEVAETVVTLETINTILTNAPEDQINETTAAIVDAAIQDINGRFEIAKAKELSIESFRQSTPAAYRQIAKEDIKGKLDALKNGLKNIIKKIVEMVQRFWQWLTLNHKRVKESLKKATVSVTAAEEQAEIAMQSRFRTLMTNTTFDAAKTVSLADYMGELCNSAGLFITSGFVEASENKSDLDVQFRSAESMQLRVKAAFKDCHEVNGAFALYTGIAGRDLWIFPAKTNGAGFSAGFVKCENDFESPEKIVLKKDEIIKILRAADNLADSSEKDFDRINRIQSKIKAVSNITKFASSMEPENLKISVMSKVLVTYNQALVAFIDGIFTQSLRFSNAAANLGFAYAKQAAKAPEPGYEGNPDAHVANAPRLA